MKMFRISLSLAFGVMMVACSGGDAPVAPTVRSATPTAQASENSAPPAAAPEESVVATPAPQATAPPTETPAAPPAPTAPTTASADDGHPYEVQCETGATAAEQCQVDKDTYVGWRTFAAQCQVCHGGSALGSTFAPNLLDRFHQRVDHPRFVEVVTNGFKGQVGAMPAWKGNPNVMPHVDQLYRYLKARADGALPAGRPARKP